MFLEQKTQILIAHQKEDIDRTQKSFLSRQKKFPTGCGSHFENSTRLKILKELLLVQKQTLHQQKALDLSYLEPEGKGRGYIMGVPRLFGAKSIFC